MLTPIERARAVTIEVARKRAGRVVAAATTGPAEVRPPKCKTCSAKRRIGRAADRRASVSKTFSGAAVIGGAAEEVSDGVVDAVEDGAGAEADDDN
jgi:hypothetical protein